MLRCLPESRPHWAPRTLAPNPLLEQSFSGKADQTKTLKDTDIIAPPKQTGKTNLLLLQGLRSKVKSPLPPPLINEPKRPISLSTPLSNTSQPRILRHLRTPTVKDSDQKKPPGGNKTKKVGEKMSKTTFNIFREIRKYRVHEIKPGC